MRSGWAQNCLKTETKTVLRGSTFQINRSSCAGSLKNIPLRTIRLRMVKFVLALGFRADLPGRSMQPSKLDAIMQGIGAPRESTNAGLKT